MKSAAAIELLVSTTLPGCAYIRDKPVSVLGTEQTKNSCGPGKSVYYYRQTNRGICLPEAMTVYTHCVTEFTVASATSNLGSTTKADIGQVKELIEGLSISAEEKRELTIAFAETGAIGEARALAIRNCRDLTEKLYGKF